MKAIRVAVAHEFVFRDDGKLIRVSGPPVDMATGWAGLLDLDDDTLREWGSWLPLKEVLSR